MTGIQVEVGVERGRRRYRKETKGRKRVLSFAHGSHMNSDPTRQRAPHSRCPGVDSLSSKVVKYEGNGSWDRLTSIYAHYQRREAIRAIFHDEQYVSRTQNANALSLNEVANCGGQSLDVDLDDKQSPLGSGLVLGGSTISFVSISTNIGITYDPMPASTLKTSSSRSSDDALCLGPKLAPFNTHPSTPSYPEPANWKFAADFGHIQPEEEEAKFEFTTALPSEVAIEMNWQQILRKSWMKRWRQAAKFWGMKKTVTLAYSTLNVAIVDNEQDEQNTLNMQQQLQLTFLESESYILLQR
ncbi:hypothetical protein GALMADRAFT_216458 [Galerina marginata CBS 339.88]|uniref:Uncharacterized protein n=1 Tax=Galerina marginata (strain CBS 339.88) TaxID=685588 RepID=A0A067S942_GALM3|nr:hypothetical protein GALMADRAFT_216458 [Galerina marginata CBS 339.88]